MQNTFIRSYNGVLLCKEKNLVFDESNELLQQVPYNSVKVRPSVINLMLHY